jgi:uncharacterized protein
MYIKRSLETIVKRAAREFPAIVLTGPRQAGKTTLLKTLLGKRCAYVSLESPDLRAAAKEDPRGFLETYRPPVIIDEIQYAPDLMPYVKEQIDSTRDRTGQYFLTGSQNLLLMSRITESLAGRAAVLKLLPLSMRETAGHPNRILPWEQKREKASGNRVRQQSDRKDETQRAEKTGRKELWRSFLTGGYPELVTHPSRDINLWHSSYIQTYLERDVRTLREIGDLSQFHSFLRLLAARSAQLFNLSDFAKDLGVAVNTVKAWLSVLEASFQVIVLRPYFANIGKRLVKTPKVYFTDVGTLCYLTGLKDPEHAAAGPMGGVIMETAVLAEIMKTLLHRGLESQAYFYRTSTGTEVDFLVEYEGKLVPIEVKLSSTPRTAMAQSVRAFQRDFGDRAVPGYVIHSGDVRFPIAPGVTALPFTEL